MKKLKAQSLKARAPLTPLQRAKISEQDLRQVLEDTGAAECIPLEVMVAISMGLHPAKVAGLEVFDRRVSLARQYFGGAGTKLIVPNALIKPNAMCTALLQPEPAFGWAKHVQGGLPKSIQMWVEDRVAAVRTFREEREGDMDNEDSPVWWADTGEREAAPAVSHETLRQKLENTRKVLGVLVLQHFADGLTGEAPKDPWHFIPSKRRKQYQPPAGVDIDEVLSREVFQRHIALSVEQVIGSVALASSYPVLAETVAKSP